MISSNFDLLHTLSLGYVKAKVIMDDYNNLKDLNILETNKLIEDEFHVQSSFLEGKSVFNMLHHVDIIDNDIIAKIDYARKNDGNFHHVLVLENKILGIRGCVDDENTCHFLSEDITDKYRFNDKLKRLIFQNQEFYTEGSFDYDKILQKFRKVTDSDLAILYLKDVKDNMSNVVSIDSKNIDTLLLEKMINKETFRTICQRQEDKTITSVSETYHVYHSVDELDLNKELKEKINDFLDIKEIILFPIFSNESRIGYFLLFDTQIMTKMMKNLALLFVEKFTDIYAKIYADKKIQHQKELIKLVIENNPSEVFVLDKDLRIIFVNKKNLDMDKNLLGKKFYPISPNISQDMSQICLDIIEGKKNSYRSKPFLNLDGSLNVTSWEIHPWKDEFDQIAGVVIYSDLHQKIENIATDLQLSNQKFNVLFKHSHVPMMYFDKFGNLEHANDAIYKLFGLDKAYSYTHLSLSKSPFVDIEKLKILEEKGFVEFESENDFSKINICGIGQSRIQTKRVLKRSITKVIQEGQVEGYIEEIQDITERRAQEDRLTHLATHDTLTGLANQIAYEGKLKELEMNQITPVTIITGNINGIKLINKSFGYSAGTKIIKDIANELKESCREFDFIARISGDEFCVVLENTEIEVATSVMNRISQKCENLHKRKSSLNQPSCSISFGIANRDTLDQSINELIDISFEQMNNHRLLDSKSSHSSILSMILATLNERSQETKEHSERMSLLAEKIGNNINLTALDIDKLKLTAKLHDIGKISVDDAILNKPGKLTDQEWLAMKKHCEAGYRIAISNPELINIADYILCHHERYDGTGYPNNVKGNEIPLISRIISLVDSYDAMTEDRPYRKALSHEAALLEIKRCSGTQFDPMIVDVFLSME